MLAQGLKMIKIFKENPIKTYLLDDFEFYENRQKLVQDKKAKQLQLQKQVTLCVVADLKYCHVRSLIGNFLANACC